MDILNLVIRVTLFCVGKSGRLAAIHEEASTIRYIKNPSEEEQLAALDGHPLFIQYIEKPSQAAQASAVNQNVLAIEYIKNPSDEIAMLVKLSE
jgi:hypothetical protein